MKCKKCKKEISISDNYCPRCGTESCEIIDGELEVIKEHKEKIINTSRIEPTAQKIKPKKIETYYKNNVYILSGLIILCIILIIVLKFI